MVLTSLHITVLNLISGKKYQLLFKDHYQEWKIVILPAVAAAAANRLLELSESILTATLHLLHPQIKLVEWMKICPSGLLNTPNLIPTRHLDSAI